MNENNLWIKRWETRELGFNQNRVNPFLKKYFHQLNLSSNNRIFIPLCGKSIDIKWLLKNKYFIVGVELSQIAINELFQELDIHPKITKLNNMKLYSANNIDIFVGDFFNLTSQMIGKIDAIYDRASLVALNKELRIKYTKHLINITNGATQLLISLEHDKSIMNRSPYSVDENEIIKHYSKKYNIKLIVREEIIGKFKNIIPCYDVIWLLK